jgi:FAD/FMN-containing dehydrogenase
MTTDTARAILEKLPDDGNFSHRIYHHQTDWDDIDIGSYADLQAMARLWLMRGEIVAAMGKAQPNCERLGLTESNRMLTDALAKITAIAGESKDGDTKYTG